MIITLLNALVPQEPNAIRLMDGQNSTTGRVEVFHEGRWGKVCYYDRTEGQLIAEIACRQLGLQGRNFDAYTLLPKVILMIPPLQKLNGCVNYEMYFVIMILNIHF